MAVSLARVVDYSKFQGTVSRASHRQMREAGIEAVCVGLWHGLDANSYALNSLANAKDEGLLRGGYVVVNSRPGAAAVQAGRQAAGGHWGQLFGVAIDVEIEGVTEAILADAFDEVVRLGQRPFLYTGNWFWDFWALQLGHFPNASRYGAWIAYYNFRADLAIPTRPGYGPIIGHQYAGSTAAFGTTVDFSVFDRDWLFAMEPPPPPPPAEPAPPPVPLPPEEKEVEMPQPAFIRVKGTKTVYCVEADRLVHAVNPTHWVLTRGDDFELKEVEATDTILDIPAFYPLGVPPGLRK